MSDQTTGKISQALGVAALREMAAKRGLHVSLHEAEQAWQDVTVVREDDRLAASWRWLFKGHTAAESPVRLLSNSQLPAWVVGSGCAGLLRQLPVDDQSADIQWMEGSVVPDDWKLETALVPVAPLANDQESYVKTEERGPATTAILAGMLAHAPIFRRVAVASTFINAIAILTSLFALQVYDRVVPNLAYATLWFLATGLAVALVLDALFKFARLRMLEASKRRLDESLSLYVFERLLGLKLDRRPARLGSLVAQVRDYESVKNFFTSSTLFAIADMPFIVLFITVIYLIGGPIAWVPTIFVVASIVLGLSVYKPIARLQRENNQTFVYVSHDEEEVMAISDRVAVVIDGQIAQIGTPDDVYSRPNALAVAQVIGSPPMNLFHGRFSADGSRFESTSPQLSCPLDQAVQQGGEGTLGIRPEDIWLNADAQDFSVAVTVSSIEPLGGYTIVNVMLGNQILKVRAPGQTDLAPGDTVQASFDQRRLHLFDADGQRL